MLIYETQFLEDFQFLSGNNTLFLKHVEDFFKYYYFTYKKKLESTVNSEFMGLLKLVRNELDGKNKVE